MGIHCLSVSVLNEWATAGWILTAKDEGEYAVVRSGKLVSDSAEMGFELRCIVW